MNDPRKLDNITDARLVQLLLEDGRAQGVLRLLRDALEPSSEPLQHDEPPANPDP